MHLVCGKVYEVSVRLSYDRELKRIRWMTTRLEYCGGSWVDNEGHHMGAGVWAVPNDDHRRYSQINWNRNLTIIPHLEDDSDLRYYCVGNQWYTKEDVRRAAHHGGRNWRDYLMTLEFENAQ
jgi:hypothetical protein